MGAAERPGTSAAVVGSSGDYAALAEIARIATGESSLQAVLQGIAEALVRLYGWEFVALVRVEREAQRFVCEAFWSLVETEVAVGYSRELGSGVVGRVARDGAPIVVDDAEEFEGFVHTLPGARSEICVPVRHRGEVVGILNVESRAVAAFRHRLPLLEAIAGQVAGAIAMVRLYEATRWRARSAEIEAEVTRLAGIPGELQHRLNRITEYLRGEFDLLLVAVVLAGPDGQQWAHQAFSSRLELSAVRTSWPTSAGIVGRALRLREAQRVLDVRSDPDYLPLADDCRAELAVPLRVGDDLAGALNFESERPEVFDSDTVALLCGLADRIAGAIELAVANERLVASQRDLAAAAARLAVANEELTRVSRLDGLTGVTNRLGFDEGLDLEWRRAFRQRSWVGLGLLDIDSFKDYNDSLGHQQGDECLRRVAACLGAAVTRAGEILARWGGEEFVVLLPGHDSGSALEAVERLVGLVATLQLPHPSSDVSPFVTMSAGVASVVPDAESAAGDLIARADAALYVAKRSGRNRVVGAGQPS